MSKTKEELRWQMESDARTLIEAEKVRGDSARKKAAIGEVKRMVKEAEDALKVTKKVSKGNAAPKKKTKKKR